MKIMIYDCFGKKILIYVNDRKHKYYGFRAFVEEKPDHWEDSDISKAEAVGKLILHYARG